MKKLLFILILCSFNVLAKPVNINSADAKSISQSLSGIGQKKAEAIVKYRNKNGLFKSLKDLAMVKGIGNKTIKKNERDILFADEKSQPKKQTKKDKKSK